MKTFKQLREKLGEMRPWKKGWDPAEFKAVSKDKKIEKDVEKYYKHKGGKYGFKKRMTVKQAEKAIPYLLNHINANYGDGKGGKVNDIQLGNAILYHYDLFDDGKGVYKYTPENVNEATGREITLDWDMGDPREYAADWKDVGVYLDHWDERKMEIEISGTEKDLLNWLVNDYGMDKKDAQKEIRKGKRIKI